MRCGNMAINVCPQSASYANRCGLRRYTAVLATAGLRHWAVVSSQPIGVDIEEIFSAQTATELTDNIITPAEHERLADCGLAFSLALTLAFSAKESAFKASEIQTDAGFLDYQIISWNKQQVIIHRENEMFAVHWQIKEKNSHNSVPTRLIDNIWYDSPAAITDRGRKCKAGALPL